MERWIEMDQQIVFSFGAWGHPCALSSVVFCLVKRQIVKFHGGPSSDGGIGRHNIAGVVGGGGGCLGLMNKNLQIPPPKISVLWQKVDPTPQKR